MSIDCSNYRIEADRKAKEMADSGKYYITGNELVQRENYRMKTLGIDRLENTNREILDKFVLKEAPRYKERKPRVDYGRLSVDIDNL